VDYTTLIASKSTPGSLRSWVRYNETFDPAEILVDAQGYIYQRMRVREMRGIVSNGSISSGVESLALPADFLDPVKFIIRYPRTVLKLRNEAALWTEYRDFDSNGDLVTDYPANYAILGTTAYFDVKTVEALRYDLLYFAQPAALSGSNTTNFLTTRYPHILRQICVGLIARSMKDYDEGDSALKIGDGMIDNAKETDDLSRRTQEA